MNIVHLARLWYNSLGIQNEKIRGIYFPLFDPEVSQNVTGRGLRAAQNYAGENSSGGTCAQAQSNLW